MPAAPRPRRDDRLLAAALALVVAGTALGPALPRLGTHLLGVDGVDTHGTAWFYWMVDRALARGEPLTHTDLLYWPWGRDLHVQTGTNVLDALLAVPLRRLLGPVPGTNTTWLLGLLSTWLAARALVRRVTREPLAVEVAAVLLALGPPVLFELGEGRPTQAILLLPVLCLLALFETARRPGLWAPVAAGVTLAATGYQYWFSAVFVGLAALSAGLVATARAAPGQRLPTLGRHALAALVAALLVLPTALPMLRGVTGGQVPGLLDVDAWTWAHQPPRTAEGQAIGTWSWQPLAGRTGMLLLHPQGGVAWSPYVRLVPPLLLALVAAGLACARRPRAWLFAALLPLAVVAVGPTLVVGAWSLPNPPMYLAMEALPFLRRLWWPARALLVAAVPASLALALLLARARAAGPLPGRLAAVGLVALHLGAAARDDLLPVPTWDATPPAGQRCLAQGPAGAVVELPWGGSQRGLAWQSAHGRPLLGGLAEGNRSLVPPETRQLIADDPLLQRLAFLGDGLPVPRLRARLPVRERSRLDDLGVVYAVVRRDELGPDPAQDAGLVHLLGEPVYQDARTWIFAPWGAPSPCADAPPAPDRVAVPIPLAAHAPPPADDPRSVRLRSPLGPPLELRGPSARPAPAPGPPPPGVSPRRAPGAPPR
ncbi:hypothetical protein L6R53_07205 [Myxococcota bacterium]|nr:hypothetical protein [Myxococcota bacterium]